MRGLAAKKNDAQATFAAACDKYECALDIMNLRTQQTNTIKEMELTESQKKGIESWLEIWGSKVLDLEEHLDHVVSDTDKRAWLTNSVRPHSQMRQAISTFQTIEHISMKPCSFEDFYEHLKGHAKSLDVEARNMKKKIRKQQQQDKNPRGQVNETRLKDSTRA